MALHSWMCHLLLSKGACCSQVLVIVLLDDVETDVESCGLGMNLFTLVMSSNFTLFLNTADCG